MPGSRFTQQRPALSTVLKRAYFSVALVAVGLAGISMTLGGLLALSRIAEHNLQLLGRSLSYTVEAAVMFRNAEAAQEAVDLIASTEEVSTIEVTDRSGDLLAQWHVEPGVFNDVEQWVFNMFLPPEVEFPIYNEGQVIGNLTLSGRGNGLTTFLAAGVLVIVASLLLSVICAFFLSRRILRGVTVPLEQLTTVAHKIRDERAFDRRLPSAAIAELDGLSRDFNDLLEELGVWEARWREENAQLSHKARHDSLTGLSNRASFESALHNAIRGEHRFALLFIDGNNFKQINDSLGHAGGDTVLVELGKRFLGCVRSGDVVARMGGDEFAVLISSLSRTEDARLIAENIHAGIREPISLPDGNSVTASVSIGIAVFPDHGDSPEDLIRVADHAMYMAKRSGKSPWVADRTQDNREKASVNVKR